MPNVTGKYAPKPVGPISPVSGPQAPEESVDDIFPAGSTPFDPPPAQEPKPLMTQNRTDSTLVVTSDEETHLEGLMYAGLDVLDALDSAEVSVALGTTYHEFNEIGETLRAVFCGMTTITKNKPGGFDTLDAVCFQTTTNIYLNSGGNLVDQLRMLKPGTPIQIRYIGTERTRSGNDFKKFEINLLRLTSGKQSEITAYWTRVKELNLTKAEANRILDQNGNNFAAALMAIEPDTIEQGEDKPAF
jgi:hypothetical protein